MKDNDGFISVRNILIVFAVAGAVLALLLILPILLFVVVEMLASGMWTFG